MRWVDERAERLRRSEPVESILTLQAQRSDREWYSTVALAYDDPAKLAFVGRILDFDPVPVLRSVTCPTLAMFGGGDTQVDAWESAELFARHLPQSVENGLVVSLAPTTACSSPAPSGRQPHVPTQPRLPRNRRITPGRPPRVAVPAPGLAAADSDI